MTTPPSSGPGLGPGARPTPRQAEYLDFIRRFTERWGIPPSFEEIGQHFMTTPPSVNNMVKTLEARGFLTRVPGQPRTLRVLLPEGRGASIEAQPHRPAPASGTAEVATAVQLASLVIERLVPALQGVSAEQRRSALDAVSQALEIVCLAAGASPAERQEARATIEQVARVAQGMAPEAVPGHKRKRRWRP
jgi:SOS-response transcriptional repressor LexA